MEAPPRREPGVVVGEGHTQGTAESEDGGSIPAVRREPEFWGISYLRLRPCMTFLAPTAPPNTNGVGVRAKRPGA